MPKCLEFRRVLFRSSAAAFVPTCAPMDELVGALISGTQRGSLVASSCAACVIVRSEERRVGKECRSRWAADHGRKKRSKVGNVQRRTAQDGWSYMQ